MCTYIKYNLWFKLAMFLISSSHIHAPKKHPHPRFLSWQTVNDGNVVFYRIDLSERKTFKKTNLLINLKAKGNRQGHFQHRYCIAKAAQNSLQWIYTSNCIFNAFFFLYIYTKHSPLPGSTSTWVFTHSFTESNWLCSSVQVGPRTSSQRVSASVTTTTFTAPLISNA